MIYFISLYVQATLYIAAGVNHFVNPRFYVSMIPKWLPMPAFLNQSSGIAEILLGLGLIFASTRQWSAWGLIAMLIVFFFLIHIPMVISFQAKGHKLLWLAWLRLPIQFLLIYWAYYFTK